MSEGQRAIPAWEMLETGDWLVPTLFGQPYLRKPPGTQWAMAISSMVFGRTEFAVRCVSVLAVVAGAALSWFFARRWFGTDGHARRCGLAAGLLFPLTPLFWYPGRSAEIESLHNTCVLAALLLGIDLLAGQARSRAKLLQLSAAFAAALTATALVKGPAAIPALIGVLIACCLVMRSVRPLFRSAFWLSLLGAGLAIGGVTWAIVARASSLPLAPVTQSPAGFLWDTAKLASILLLPISSLVSALPGSLLLPWAFRKSVSSDDPGRRIAQILVLTIAVTLLLYTVLGVSNNRYAMPVLTLVPIAAAFAFRGFSQATEESDKLWMRLGRLALLHRAAVPVCILTIATIAHHAWLEVRRERISGRSTGEAVSRVVPDGSLLIANQMIEYRPETFLYAQRAASKAGHTITVRWIPPHVEAPSTPAYLALRTPPDGSMRSSAFENTAAANPNRAIVFRGIVHRFEMEIIAPN